MKKQSTVNNSLKTALGPIWKIYADESVYTICIDAFDDVYYYSNTGAKVAPKLFKTVKELDAVIRKLITKAGKKVLPETQSLYFNLDDYNRVNIVFPPLAVKGPTVLLTRIPKQEVTLSDLIKYNALDAEGKNLIEKMIEDGQGILVAGKVGSGKTTLLNTLVEAIPQPQRVVTLERYADLVIHRPKVCRLQTESQKAEEMVGLVAIAERMYPDYLILSQCTGPEVMPFLELIRNNCSGMALITGENPLDALKRLETKAVLSSEGMSLEDARYAISQSFQRIIFQERREGNKRLVSSIGEIQYDAGELRLKIIYKR